MLIEFVERYQPRRVDPGQRRYRFTLVNDTLESKTFFIEEAVVTQEVPAGETVTIIVNAPVGEYGYGLLETRRPDPSRHRGHQTEELRLLANEVLVFVEQAVARQILLGLRESLTIAGQLGGRWRW